MILQERKNIRLSLLSPPLLVVSIIPLNAIPLFPSHVFSQLLRVSLPSQNHIPLLIRSHPPDSVLVLPLAAPNNHSEAVRVGVLQLFLICHSLLLPLTHHRICLQQRTHSTVGLVESLPDGSRPIHSTGHHRPSSLNQPPHSAVDLLQAAHHYSLMLLMNQPRYRFLPVFAEEMFFPIRSLVDERLPILWILITHSK